ncbi:MAG: (d)CMP kinase [Ruminococcaceae bacterium]|nr:(d)CMP kinase [Oscillospiraceae bacterium]
MEICKLRVALDGPSGAGKSTVAKAVAAKTGLVYVDTGALYRTVGLYAAEHGIKMDDTQGIIDMLPEVEIKLAYENGEQKVYLCGEAVGNKIRTESASAYASAVSKIPEVRAFLLDMQKKIAAGGGVIMDGRDIGTVIMPDAELKVFMTATPEERARRRHKEQVEKGIDVSYESVLENIIARDKQDSEREAAPLRPADDAVYFVNDGYDVEGSADYIIDLMEKRASGLE